MRVSPVNGTWYKVTTSVVVSQLKVLNYCGFLKVFGTCDQILIKVTTFRIKDICDQFLTSSSSELEKMVKTCSRALKKYGCPRLLTLRISHVAWEQVCDEMGHFTVYAAHVRRLAPMPSLHSQSCKILSCLGAYYSQVQAGPAHNCLPVAIMFRNQLTNCDHLFSFAFAFASFEPNILFRIK